MKKVMFNQWYIILIQEIQDIYSTFDPQKSLQIRIEFLNKIHNDAQKGLKYPEVKGDKKKEKEEVDDDDMTLDIDLMDF